MTRTQRFGIKTNINFKTVKRLGCAMFIPPPMSFLDSVKVMSQSKVSKMFYKRVVYDFYFVFYFQTFYWGSLKAEVKIAIIKFTLGMKQSSILFISHR